MNKLLCFLGGALLLSNIRAQEIKPLNIGDTLPDIVLHHVLNYKDSVVRLSDFEDKLVILDFWATWCTNCIAGFRHVDSLQKEYKNSFLAFLVNSNIDTDEKIKQFLKSRHNKFPNEDLAVVAGDTILKQYFPHRYIPHYVWIKNRRVKAITDPSQLTKANIKQILDDDNPVINIKKDIINYDVRKTLPENATNVIPKYYSLISGEVDGVGGGARVLENDSIKKRVFFNHTILQLYTDCYRIAANKILISTADSAERVQNDLQSSFCYEQIVPLSIPDDLMTAWMATDLDRFFRLNSSVKILPLTCFIVQKKVGQIYNSYSAKGILMATHKGMHKISITTFVNHLNYSTLPNLDDPRFVSSGIRSGSDSIWVSNNFFASKNIPEAKKLLESQGWEMVRGIRPFSVLVLQSYQTKTAIKQNTSAQ